MITVAFVIFAIIMAGLGTVAASTLGATEHALAIAILGSWITIWVLIAVGLIVVVTMPVWDKVSRWFFGE